MTEVGRVTAVIDGDISGLTSALNQARSQATTAVSGIEGQLKSGLTKATTGNWKDVGRTVGSDLVSGITAPLGSLSGAASGIATALGPAGIAATAAVAGAAMIGSAASKSAMEWETGMAQISKTTGIEKGTAEFAELNAELKDLYSAMPTTRSEIQSVAQAAGSLGIEKSAIAGFTEVALEMGSAFDIPAEEAATAMGKIKGQLKSLPEGATDSAEFARKMGSAVDYVGNNFNATERDVLDFSTRIAGSMSTLGGSAYEVAGWGGMLASVFPSAERAAGSFDALLTQLTTNTDSQAKASELLGMSTEEFMAAMSTDPSDTILRLGAALESLPAEKIQETTKTLGGAYGMDTLVKMVGHTEEWRQAIQDTVAAGEQGTSIGQSFAAGADTAQAAFQILKNSISTILGDIGGPINAALTPVIKSLSGTFDSVRTIGENLWEPFTTAISPATEAVSLLASGVAEIGGTTLSGLVTATSAVNTAFQTGKAFVTAFKDELTSVITQSSTFQTISGYVEKVGDAFDSLKNKASDALSGIVSWLSEAIPSAISGVTEKLGSMFSGVTESLGLGGMAGSVGGAVSGVTGFFSNVYDHAAKELGWKTEEAVATGTEKGMETGVNGAKSAIENVVGDAIGDAWVKSSGWAAEAGMTAVFDNSGKIVGYRSTLGEKGKESNITEQSFNILGQTWTLRETTTAQSKFTSAVGPNGEIYDLGMATRRFATNEKGDIVQFWDEFKGSGEDATDKIAQAYYDSMKSEIRDSSKFMETQYTQMSKDLGDIVADGIFSDTEKKQLEVYKNLLEMYQQEFPLDFTADDAKLLQNIDDILSEKIFQINVEADTEDLFSTVWDALQSGKAVDWSELGISNPERFFEAAKEDLRSDISQYAKEGIAVPLKDAEGNVTSIGKELLALQAVFHENYSSLDTANRISSDLLDQAIAKGGLYWDQLYAHMGLLSNQVSSSGSSLETKSTAGAQRIFNAGDYVSTKLDSSGNKMLVIGDSARSGGVAGGAATARGGRDAASALVSGAITAANNLRYSTLGGLTLDTGNLFGKLSTATKTSGTTLLHPLTEETTSTTSGLWSWGGVPKGWTEAVSQAGTATASANTKTNGLCTSVTSLGVSSAQAATSIQGLNTALASGVSNQYHPLYEATQQVSNSAYDTSEALKYTAESMDNWCEAASDFAKWQETTAGLFYQSYIGPTAYYPGSRSSSGVSGSSGVYYNQVGTAWGSQALASANPTWQLPAIFRARGGIVDRPELAVIGEAGTEMVLPPAVTKAVLDAVGRGGGPQGISLTINSPITIQGSANEADIESILSRRNKELVDQITEKIASSQRWP